MPGKDNNLFTSYFNRRTLPIFECIDYIIIILMKKVCFKNNPLSYFKNYINIFTLPIFNYTNKLFLLYYNMHRSLPLNQQEILYHHPARRRKYGFRVKLQTVNVIIDVAHSHYFTVI